ncbi:hypothetical protein LSAT2_012611 [Lamellibrachia satsuma]|nr:hypothetical protein LSAT2_012611 [Lamellibrachia satsuma]
MGAISTECIRQPGNKTNEVLGAAIQLDCANLPLGEQSSNCLLVPSISTNYYRPLQYGHSGFPVRLPGCHVSRVICTKLCRSLGTVDAMYGGVRRRKSAEGEVLRRTIVQQNGGCLPLDALQRPLQGKDME